MSNVLERAGIVTDRIYMLGDEGDWLVLFDDVDVNDFIDKCREYLINEEGQLPEVAEDMLAEGSVITRSCYLVLDEYYEGDWYLSWADDEEDRHNVVVTFLDRW